MPTSLIRVAQVMECTIGGTRRHLRELCLGLQETGQAGGTRGVQISLFASAARDPTFRDDLRLLAGAGIEVVEVPMRRAIDPARDLIHTAKLARAFRRGRFDVIHTHSSKAGALGRAAAIAARSPAARIHTPHTFAFTFADEFGPAKRRVFLGVERLLGRASDRIVHVSESERREAERFGIVPEGRAVVIPNGIDPEPFAAADGSGVRAELGLPPGAPIVGSVGLLNAAKGFAHLVSAAAVLRAEVPDVTVVIAGEGELRARLEERIFAAGLSRTVQLLGFRRDVPRLMAAFDVFVLPSLWEGLPYVVMEAMAAHRPVVATDVNGSRDLVVHEVTGLIVPPGDPAALASALLRLLRDEPARRAFGERGARRVRDEYALEVMLERYRDLYRSVLPCPR